MAENGYKPLVAVIMGSQSDWETMRHADETLSQFGVEHECVLARRERAAKEVFALFTTYAAFPAKSFDIKQVVGEDRLTFLQEHSVAAETSA